MRWTDQQIDALNATVEALRNRPAADRGRNFEPRPARTVEASDSPGQSVFPGLGATPWQGKLPIVFTDCRMERISSGE